MPFILRLLYSCPGMKCYIALSMPQNLKALLSGYTANLLHLLRSVMIRGLSCTWRILNLTFQSEVWKSWPSDYNYAFHCVIHKLYKSYTQVIHKLYKSYTQVIHKLYTTYTQVIHNLYTSYTQVIHKLYTSYIQVIHKLYTTYTQLIHKVYTSYT